MENNDSTELHPPPQGEPQHEEVTIIRPGNQDKISEPTEINESHSAMRPPEDGAGQPEGLREPAQAPQENFQANHSGYVVDPVTGQLFYKVPVMQPDAGTQTNAAPLNQPIYQQPISAEQQSPPDYSQVIQSVEKFAEGEATVGDVIKSLYATTTQDDQFWKGALVGAAATVLLTSGPIGATMGKTLNGLFGKTESKAATASVDETVKETITKSKGD